MSEQEKFKTGELAKLNEKLYGIAIGILGLFVIGIFFVITAFSSHSEGITTNKVKNEAQDTSIERLEDNKADTNVVEMIMTALERIEKKIDEK